MPTYRRVMRNAVREHVWVSAHVPTLAAYMSMPRWMQIEYLKEAQEKRNRLREANPFGGAGED